VSALRHHRRRTYRELMAIGKPGESMPAESVLEVRRHSSLTNFMLCSAALYRSDPVAFSTESGVLAELTAAPRPSLFLTAHSGDALVGAALRPLAYPMLTSGISAEAAAAIAGTQRFEQRLASLTTRLAVIGVYANRATFSVR